VLFLSCCWWCMRRLHAHQKEKIPGWVGFIKILDRTQTDPKATFLTHGHRLERKENKGSQPVVFTQPARVSLTIFSTLELRRAMHTYLKIGYACWRNCPMS
jgi:hypothetical protein